MSVTRLSWWGYALLLLAVCVVPGDADIRLGGGGGGGSGSSGLAISEVDGAPAGTFTTLKFSNGAVTDNGDGTATIVTGVGGGGDASTNTATSVDTEIAVFSGTGGKTLKRATTSGILFGTAGVLSAAVAGTHYVAPGGALGTPSSGVATNLTGLPLSTGVTGDLPYANLTPATAASRLFGRGSASGAGDWQEVTLGASLTMSGTELSVTTPGVTDGDKTDITVTGSGATWTVDPGAITYAKMQNISGVSRLLGRAETGGAGPPQEITLGSTMIMTGTVLDAVTTGGDITGIGNCLTGQCDVVGNLRHTPMVTSYTPATGVFTITLGNTQVADFGTVTAAFTVANPTGTAYDKEFLKIHVCSDAARAITAWGSEFRARYGVPLPTFTTGTTNCDLWGFQRDQAALKWDMVATSQGSRSAPLRTCAIVIGDDDPSSPVIADARLTNQYDICMLPATARVEEVTVKADAGTPNVVVHRRTSAGTVTPLLGSALATNASGTLNCARSSAEAAQAGFAGTTCTTTLTEANRIIGAGDWLGLTSGSGSTARRFSIMVSYTLLN